MQIAVCGLGRMGAGMARRLARGGHDVVAWNRTEQVAVDVAAEPENEGRITVAEPLETLLEHAAGPRHVIISVPSGDATDAMIDQLAAMLEPGDVIVDAGNSNFHDSQRRAAALAEKGLEWLDMGVSGGVWGLEVGFCAMIGGKREVFERFEPAVKTLAPEEGYLYCGPAGAGHYVKMVHNGIEYGIMQAYAEGYELLDRSGLDIDVVGALDAWRAGSVVRSWLLDLLVRALRQTPDLNGIAGVAQDSGEGRWTVQEAIERGVATPVISAALYARFVSQQEDSIAMKTIAALRNQFGGHAVLPETD
jgi:6-phosphogluconate dehydrogenase